MIEHILNLFKTLFIVSPWIVIPLILITTLGIIFLIFISIIITLDTVYRPETKQYPFNFILDHLAPIISIFSPIIIVCILNPVNISLIEKFGYIIITHCLFIMPIIYYWSKHRHWFRLPDFTYFSLWKSPELYYQITLAMLYPMILGIYFNSIRYLRMGKNITLTEIMANVSNSEIAPILFLIIISLPNLYVIGKTILYFISMIRNFIWNHTSLLIYSIHLECLSFNFYFKLMEKLFKFHFIWFNLISLNAPLNIDKERSYYSFWRRLIHYLYYYPKILSIIPLSIIFIELYFWHQLWLTYYMLFWVSLIIFFFRAFGYLGRSSFIKDVCTIDFIMKRVPNVRYPTIFWFFSENPELFYGFTINLSTREHKAWEKEYQKFSQKNKIYSLTLSSKVFEKMIELKKDKQNTIALYFEYIKRAYYKTYSVRWL